jgi:hypothetical protein
MHTGLCQSTKLSALGCLPTSCSRKHFDLPLTPVFFIYYVFDSFVRLFVLPPFHINSYLPHSLPPAPYIYNVYIYVLCNNSQFIPSFPPTRTLPNVFRIYLQMHPPLPFFLIPFIDVSCLLNCPIPSQCPFQFAALQFAAMRPLNQPTKLEKLAVMLACLSPFSYEYGRGM